MRSSGSSPIDPHQDYPCPCSRRGRLVPIALTEALGCERCQQIFVVNADREAIEQLTSAYPYKRFWRWTGTRWQLQHSPAHLHQWPSVLALIFVVFMGWSFLALHSPLALSIILGLLITATLMMFVIYSLWLSYRR